MTDKKPRGKPITVNSKQRTVMLDDATYARCRELGNGNASAGIRLAVGEVGK